MSSREVVLVFPGQGSQRVGMGRDWSEEFPAFRETLEEASQTLGMDVARLCFEDPHSQLGRTQFTQVALLTVSTGIDRVLKQHYAIRPRFVAGHSLGEYSALVSAGALSFTDALRTVWFRGEAMSRALSPGIGTMAAYIGTHGAHIQELCQQLSTPDSVVEVANFNAPTQLVLSGHVLALQAIRARIEQEELGSLLPLAVASAFHSSLMQPAAAELAWWLSGIQLRPLQVPIVTNVDACLHLGDEYGTDLLVRQIVSPVLWHQSTQRILSEAPDAVWIEVGPGEVLKKLLKRARKQCIAFSSDSVSNLSGFEQNLGSQAA